MNLELRFKSLIKDQFPKVIPAPVLPIQENAKMIVGEKRAIKVFVEDKETYLYLGESRTVEVSGKKHTLKFDNRSITLPFELTLDRFQMNFYPGTTDPSSYESFVKSNDEPDLTHHIFMNNPLKKNNLTFYQASYFPLGPNRYGSILSVNYDPGRFLKYFGSLIIVLGSIWHYIIRRRGNVSDSRIKPKGATYYA
jgi:hypothetical protein